MTCGSAVSHIRFVGGTRGLRSDPRFEGILRKTNSCFVANQYVICVLDTQHAYEATFLESPRLPMIGKAQGFKVSEHY